MASITAVVEADSAASPSAVYEFLTDPSKMSQWINGISEARWADGARLLPKNRILMKYEYRKRVSDIIMEIDAAEPGRRFAYHTVEGPYPIRVDFTLAPSGRGTRITFKQEALSDSASSGFMFGLFGWALKPMVRKVLRKDLQKAAALAAGEPAPA